jgi:hypothetical protein
MTYFAEYVHIFFGLALLLNRKHTVVYHLQITVSRVRDGIQCAVAYTAALHGAMQQVGAAYRTDND